MKELIRKKYYRDHNAVVDSDLVLYKQNRDRFIVCIEVADTEENRTKECLPLSVGDKAVKTDYSKLEKAYIRFRKRLRRN